MSDGISVDPQQLNNFATAVRELVTNLNTAQGVVSGQQLKFGQDADYPLRPSFPPALMLSGQLKTHAGYFDENFTTLVNKLNMLADTADAIAKGYTTAADLDSMSASAVSSMLNAAAAAGPQTTVPPGNG